MFVLSSEICIKSAGVNHVPGKYPFLILIWQEGRRRPLILLNICEINVSLTHPRDHQTLWGHIRYLWWVDMYFNLGSELKFLPNKSVIKPSFYFATKVRSTNHLITFEAWITNIMSSDRIESGREYVGKREKKWIYQWTHWILLI